MTGAPTRLCDYFWAAPIPYWGLVVEIVCKMIKLVFCAQLVWYRSRDSENVEFWFQVSGITTGLSCATQLANLFLVALDLAVRQEFRAAIISYKRFVDDVWIRAYDVDVADLLVVLNSFDVALYVMHESEENGKSPTFLDLHLWVSDGQVLFSTFRKPMCTYAYLPYSSNHPGHTKLGIVRSELDRLLKTNHSPDAYRDQVAFFADKLRKRGFRWTVLEL